MENYFDIATPEEIEERYDEKLTSEEIKELRLNLERQPDINYQYLFLLFIDRGENDKANYYLEQIKDPMIKLNATMLAYELRG